MNERVNLTSRDEVNNNIEQLKQLFPSIVQDGKIDFETLKLILGEEIDNEQESYKFEWVGKKNCYKTIQTPSNGTLKYIEEDSLYPDIGENIIIEGDNLEVLKLLQSSYKESIKMIYIDPPYNTGNDFVYSDNYETPLDNYFELTGQKVNGEDTQSKKSKEGRKHTQWLNMIFPRLLLSRTLLKEEGLIFISIDDSEYDNLKKLCDEVFGEENFVSNFIWKKKQGGGNDSNLVVVEHEYILVYSKNQNKTKLNLDTTYELDDKLYPFKDKLGEYGLVTLDKSSIRYSDSLVFEIKDSEGNIYTPRVIKGKQSCWRWGKDKVEKEKDKLVFKDGKVYTKYYRPNGITPKSLLIDTRYGRTESGNDDIKKVFDQDKPFSYPKPISLIKHFIQIGLNDNDIILDFFGGSGTTGHSVLEMNREDNGNRKFILVQLQEPIKNGDYSTISEITKERMRRVIKGYGDNPQPINDGFKVFKLDNSNYKINETINVNKDTDKEEIISRLRKQFRQSIDFEERFVKGYTQTDIIYENIIKEGYNLNSKIEVVEDIEPYKVYRVTDSVKKDKKFYITFDNVDIDIKLKNEFMGISNDTLFICIDHLLSDSDKDNLKDTFQLKTL